MSKRLSFMDPLVLAVMADEKTVTRRMTEPRLKAGDVVDVCEALVPRDDGMGYECVAYRTDGAIYRSPGGIRSNLAWPWKVRVLPARYCPAWAVRTRIEVVDVRREPLSAVTDDDAGREGITRMGLTPTRADFLDAFRLLHELATDADPDVWRIEFRRVPASALAACVLAVGGDK